MSTLFEASPDGILVAASDGRIVRTNPRAEVLFGYADGELVGMTVEALLPERFRSKHVAHRAAFFAHPRVRPMGICLYGLRKDGTEFPVDIMLSSVVAEDGSIAALAFVRDITAQTEREEALRRSEDLLRQAQKMEAIGRLAGGIAHDFNNLLSVILSYATLMSAGREGDAKLCQDAREIEEAARRAAGLTRQLLAMSRRQVLEPDLLDVNLAILQVERMLGRLLGEHITITTALEPNLGPVFVDATHLEQVLVNLAVNARDAMPDGGVLHVSTHTLCVREGELRKGTASIPAGTYVVITVRDTGSGIDEAALAHVFEPFFTTKGEKGTGLGLATVYGIVIQSGGRIAVESAPGEGTAFSIYLPLAEARNPTPPTSGSPPRGKGGGERLLLVEDDEALRTVLQAVLARAGYSVLVAATGGEALERIAGLDAPIDMVLTDVVMPGLSGPKLVGQLRTTMPALRVLYMSGYPDVGATSRTLMEGAAFLGKPFGPVALLDHVRQVLDGEV